MSALVQISHRMAAYLLIIIVLWFSFKVLKLDVSTPVRVGCYLLMIMLAIQVILGILTVINCIGIIPIGLGVFHQAGALLLLTIMLFLNYQMVMKRSK